MSVYFDPNHKPWYGHLQSPADPRDFIYKNFMAAQRLPSSFLPDRIQVRDQGKEGTCVGFAASYIKNYQERKNHPGRGYTTSPRFVYSECKKVDGIAGEGTFPRVAMDVLRQSGTCLESTLPYVAKETPTISQSAYEEAKQFVIKAYAKIQSFEEIKTALMNEGPVMAGVIVTDSFVYPTNGVIGEPEGKWWGGHAIALDGWDDSRKAFRFINSWGVSWGDQGYAWLPYSFLTYRNIDLGGMPFFQEAWSSLDTIMPNPAAKEVVMWLNRDTAIVDGMTIELDQSPIAPDGRTLVPLRFLSEIGGWNVDWEPVEKRITLRR